MFHRRRTRHELARRTHPLSRHTRKLWPAVVLVGAVGLLGAPAQADGDPDWDGDGAVALDCRPLDAGVHPGATDVPDLAFEDGNCDGIDGDPDHAFFVQPSGSDANVGTPNAPFQTLQKAINEAAASATKKSIYIATGSYGRATLPTTADGLRIYGGYAAGTWARTTSTSTVVSGQPEALLLDGARDVALQLVELSGSRGTGLNAYGVRAINGSELALIRSKATAGAGGQGGAGAGGSTPGKAADGDPGDTGPNCDTSGTGGVVSQPGNGTDGGAGGRGGEETNDGENGNAGTKGSGTGGGAAGAGGVDVAGDAHGPNDGMHGLTGGQGDTGAGGSSGSGGGSDLGAAGVGWAGRNGGDGSNGGTGYGGGGGGGGAGRGNMVDWGAGAGGGQGGDGGSGGTRGFGGGWGGGSVGVYLHGSDAAVVDGSALTAGNGGAGGAGGTGGSGGQGGNGGAGGAARTDCGITVGAGGAGGPGGPGGKGGDGGGGSGGPSAALMRTGVSNATDRNSTLTNGTGGAGGSGGGAAGQSGQRLPATGSAPTDFDGDGITDAADGCVDVHRGGTDANGDGCPDRPAALPDGDGDGVPNDGRDACPSQAATSDANDDGCTDVTATPDPDPTTDPSSTGTPSTTTTSRETGTTTATATGTATLTTLPPAFAPRFAHNSTYARGVTRITGLRILDLPPGAKLTLACSGGKQKGCTFKRRSASSARLRKLVAKLRLKKGAVLEVRAVSADGQVKLARYAARGNRAPKTTYLCAAKGAKLSRCA